MWHLSHKRSIRWSSVVGTLLPNLRTRTQRKSVIPTAHSISSAIFFFKLGSWGEGVLLRRFVLGSSGRHLISTFDIRQFREASYWYV